MEGRKRERCSKCMVHITVPQEAQSMECPVCQTTTSIRPGGGGGALAQANDLITQATGRYKGLVNTVSSNIRPVINRFGSSNKYNYPQAVGYKSPQQPQQPQQPSSLMDQTKQPTRMLSCPQQPPRVFQTTPPPRVLYYPSAYGKKRAVVCGMSYKGKRYKIKGGVNDAMAMRGFLVGHLGFPTDSVLVLTEEEKDRMRIPTKQNIRMALKWLVQGCQAGDSLVFHYSGHGAREKDYNMDEIDGYDEVICPVDFETEGKIIDDEINETIVRPLPNGAVLHAIIDSCYSGTVLDLPFSCNINKEGGYMWEDQRTRTSSYKGTNGGLALCISACEDDKTSADTTAFSSTMSGAMTYSFIKAAKFEVATTTYGALLNAMRNIINEAKATQPRLTATISNIRNTIFRTQTSQGPQLSSSETFDIYNKKFII